MKSNPIPNPQSPIPNTRIFILLIAIALAFFACGKITEGDEDGIPSNLSSDSNPYGNDPIQNSDPPAGVIVAVNSTSSITIGWGVVSGADGYYIYRSESTTGTYIQVGISATTSYEDNGLSAGTTYYYRIAAYNTYGTGSQSSLVSATTLPNAPNGVTATVNSTNSIIVDWETVFGATGYYIYRSESAYGDYTQVGSSATNSYTNASLSSGTTYYYKVAAYNSGGIGVQSSNAYATTQPGMPTGVTATANSNISIIVDWVEVQGATGYYIYRNSSASGTYEQIGNSTEAMYEDTGLSSNTAYYYRVVAYNDGGTGSQSSYASATTLLLSTPINLTLTTNSTSSITFSWTAVQDATEYHIYRNTSAGGTYEQIGISGTNSYTDNNLLVGTIYYYRVAAYNSGGRGEQSSYISLATLPSTPTNITATVNSASSITVGWVAVSGATGYYIYSSTSADGYYSQVGTSETSSYTNDNYLSSATTYYYKVAAYNSGGIGAQSSYINATTYPSAPTGVTATANSTTSITVDWSEVYGATGYYVYRSTSSGGTYTQVGSTTTTSYTNTGLTAGTTYYYKVAAYNTGGTGAQSSSTVSIATLPNTPSGVTATASSTASSTSSITVSWTAVSGATGYYIYRSASASGTYTQIGTSTESVYEDTGLSTGTTYYYKVAAYNSGGTGAQSNTVYTTTQLGTPTGLTATTNSTSSITISWAAVSGAMGYYIYRSESTSGEYIEIDNSEKNSYTDNSLSNSVTYYYKVAAYYNNSVTGAQSSYINATTSYGSVSHGGQTYKTIKIGDQIWMAENLNYATSSGSACYNNSDANCAAYGRLYDWATAMNLNASCNSSSCSDQMNSKHQGICPTGWHIPTSTEWATLENYVGGSSRYLKATSGWSSCSPSGSSYLCEDTHGFAALPGGYSNSGGSFSNDVGNYGYWWSTSESYSTNFAYYMYMIYNDEVVYTGSVYYKSFLHSVRCLQD